MVSCGARLAPFDIEELREVTAYDELELDTLGDRKTALFLIMSDTDASFNFLISMIYSQLFNLLCEKADDVYGGRYSRSWQKKSRITSPCVNMPNIAWRRAKLSKVFW